MFVTKINPKLQCVELSLAAAPWAILLKGVIMCYTT